MSYCSRITSQCARGLITALLVLGACAEPETRAEDARCLDPRIGTQMLDDPGDRDAVRTIDPPVIAGFCDGSDDIRLVVLERLGPGTLSDLHYLDRYHGAYLVIDGKCHFYTFDHRYYRLGEGVLSPEMVAQLTADLRLDKLASLPSTKDTVTDHYSDTLIATPAQSLRCREERCRDPEALAAIREGLRWLDRLAEQGRPSTGEMTLLAFPTEATSDLEWEQRNPILEWPLEQTLRSIRNLVVSSAAHEPRGVSLYGGATTVALRDLRSRALAAHDPPAAGRSTFRVNDCGQLYRLMLRDELSELDSQLQRFLDQAWARAVIADCITSSDNPAPVSPCPDDEEL